MRPRSQPLRSTRRESPTNFTLEADWDAEPKPLYSVGFTAAMEPLPAEFPESRLLVSALPPTPLLARFTSARRSACP
jgi:hypothetical protein